MFQEVAFSFFRKKRLPWLVIITSRKKYEYLGITHYFDVCWILYLQPSKWYTQLLCQNRCCAQAVAYVPDLGRDLVRELYYDKARFLCALSGDPLHDFRICKKCSMFLLFFGIESSGMPLMFIFVELVHSFQ